MRIVVESAARFCATQWTSRALTDLRALLAVPADTQHILAWFQMSRYGQLVDNQCVEWVASRAPARVSLRSVKRLEAWWLEALHFP